MSLMGYTDKDINNMMENLYKAYSLIDDAEIKINLIDTAGFLEGLIIEGRI